MPNATVTIRELKNKQTGIDLAIPSHKEVAGLISSTFEYHVVVVSNLPCFKSAAHKEGETVQFMILKHFEDFEELRRRLMIKYTGFELPPLPKKGFNVLGDSHAKEKRFALETFLCYVAQSPKLVHSTITLEFLGVNAVTANSFSVRSGPLSTDKNEDTTKIPSQSHNLFGDEEEEEEEDLFGGGGNGNNRPSDVKYSAQLFESAVTPMDPLGNTKLFEDQDYGGAVGKDEGEDFLFPLGATNEEEFTLELEDNSDILNIQDDLDKKLNISKSPKQSGKPTISTKPAISAKPALPMKPSLPTKPGVSTKPAVPSRPKKSSVEPTKSSEELQDSSKLDASDIFKYISDNEKGQSEDLDLFS